jgi:hypothetical protein
MVLGAVGAEPLGFLAAAMGFGGIVDGLWPAWFPPLVVLPFVADATVTLALRLVRGERVWEAHNVHYYQRLHRLGAGHRGTLAVYGALMAGTASTAVACASLYPAWGAHALAAWCAVCLLLFAAIDYHWRKSDCICPPELPVCVCGGNRRVLRRVVRRPLEAPAAEIAANPRARSAKLRVMEKL